MRRPARLLFALAVLAGLASAPGCGESVELAPIECSDGYMAPATEGCLDHGGARDPFMESVNAYLDAFPDDEPVGYVCGDGWLSTSVGETGACSWHDGVYGYVYADGTRFLTEGRARLVHPDGTTEYLPPISP